MERDGQLISLSQEEQQASHLPANIKVDNVSVIYQELGERINAAEQVRQKNFDDRTVMSIIRLGKDVAVRGILTTLRSMRVQLYELAPEQLDAKQEDGADALLQDWAEDIDPDLRAQLDDQ